MQAPASSVDVFGSVARSVPVVPPAEPAAVATHSLQNLQDLAMMGFSDHKRYEVISTLFCPLFNWKSEYIALAFSIHLFLDILTDLRIPRFGIGDQSKLIH